MVGFILIVVLIIAAVALVATNVRIVPQAQAYVIERLGAYKGCLLYTSPSPRDRG